MGRKDSESVRVGQRLTKPQTNNNDNKEDHITFDAPPVVVIMERYFNDIAPVNFSVKTVVTSKGTALLLEQLMIVAEMGNVPGGEILFLLYFSLFLVLCVYIPRRRAMW